MNTDLWFGAATTLAGAALGGAISYLLCRQQITEARAQRLEGERWDRARRSAERRLDAYACGRSMISRVPQMLPRPGYFADGQPWDKLNEDMERALRNFHAAAREELGVEDAAQRRGQAHAEPI